VRGVRCTIPGNWQLTKQLCMRPDG
jgi:hypothetical protein